MRVNEYSDVMSLKAILFLLLADFCTKVIAGAPPVKKTRMDDSEDWPRLLAIDLGGNIGLILFTRYQNCAYQHLINGDQRSGLKIVLWMTEIADKQEKTLFISDYRDVDVNSNTWKANTCIPKLIEDDRVLYEKTLKESDTFPVSKGWHGVKNVEKRQGCKS